jgi:hypothetical protein
MHIHQRDMRGNPFKGPQNGRHVRSSRHVLIERKAKSNAGGLHVLLIIMWPDTTLAILLLQLLLN